MSWLYDGLTSAAPLWGQRAGPAEFRTGWFVESVVSAALIVLANGLSAELAKRWFYNRYAKAFPQ